MDSGQAYIFDVFGTLVDWRSSIARQVADVLPQVDANAFALDWRSRYQPAMERVRAGERDYVPVDVLHREMLDETLAEFGVDVPDRSIFARAWEKLGSWPGVSDQLADLRQRALIAPCSNGSIALMTRLARFAGLPWDTVLGADIAQNYKPVPQVYLSNCAVLGLAPEQVTMVACHNDDLVAARAAGLRTAFIARPTEYGPDQDFDLEPAQDWDEVVTDLAQLATRPSLVSR
jgi:2-haloacid dehalogenase